ncbi:hypothetical protein [Haladaptatus sp. DYSN1]|uniref:hypothetical protein n=1 Tax=unclassified Haladaptatus TaxID=2622732 RepID=UPI0024055820|nr:hypothetical protein [Haladaptatus sp. DYSN1]
MTDKEKQSPDRVDDTESGADHTPITGSKATGEADDAETGDSLLSGQIDIQRVDKITTGKQEETIGEPIQLRSTSDRVSPHLESTAEIGVNRVSDTIIRQVAPQPVKGLSDLTFTGHQISVRRIVETATSESPVNATRTTSSMARGSVIESHEIDVTRIVERVGRESRPKSTLELAPLSSTAALLDELEDIDPVFEWIGGLPYSGDRPKCIVHRDDTAVPSFEFLQRCLRDVYAETRGGEPRVKQAEFVANELRVPSVPGAIVIVDMTDGDWSPSLTNGRPSIEHSGVDIVPEFVDHVETLYGGGLGYLLINLPHSWDDSFRLSGFFDAFVEQLTAASMPESDERGDTTEKTGVLEKLQISPVTIATPRVTDPEVFGARVAQYYAFDSMPNTSWETIAQADSALQTLLRSGRWTQVVLTERQDTGDESDRHYNWKGVITEGLARALRREAVGNNESFGRFVRETLLPEDYLTTEHRFGEGENSVVADIYLKGSKPWIRNGLADFQILDEDVPAVLEFETGFAESAFQYRKIAETLDKYQGQTSNINSIYVVIPPRLLYRGRQQAELIKGIVTANAAVLEETTVKCCIPILNNGTCIGLRLVTDLTEVLYE